MLTGHDGMQLMHEAMQLMAWLVSKIFTGHCLRLSPQSHLACKLMRRCPGVQL